jgi:hypothetical protein
LSAAVAGALSEASRPIIDIAARNFPDFVFIVVMNANRLVGLILARLIL